MLVVISSFVSSMSLKNVYGEKSKVARIEEPGQWKSPHGDDFKVFADVGERTRGEHGVGQRQWNQCSSGTLDGWKLQASKLTKWRLKQEFNLATQLRGLHLTCPFAKPLPGTCTLSLVVFAQLLFAVSSSNS